MKLAQSKGDLAKQREFLWRLAEVRDRQGELEKAEGSLKDLLDMRMDSEEQSIEALCFLADVQVPPPLSLVSCSGETFVQYFAGLRSGRWE